MQEQKSVEVSGKSVDEAVFKGLMDLGATLDEVRIEILKEESKGVLGFGARRALVRLTMRDPEEMRALYEIEPLQEAREPRVERDPRERRERGGLFGDRAKKRGNARDDAQPKRDEQPKRQERDERKERAEQPRHEETARDAQPKRQERDERKERAEQPKREETTRDEQPKRDEREATARPAPETHERHARDEHPRRDERHRDERNRDERNRDYRDRDDRHRDERRYERGNASRSFIRESATYILDDDPLFDAPSDNEAAVFLAGMLERMGVSSKLAVHEGDDAVRIKIQSDSMGILIGHRGETLDSMQYLCSLVLNHDRKEYRRLTLDTENYRVKREETLTRLAERLAEQVVRSGETMALEPMNPYERRVMHSTLQNHRGVYTYSEGEEPYRKVIIARKP